MREKVKPNNLFETKRHCVAELVACRCSLFIVHISISSYRIQRGKNNFSRIFWIFISFKWCSNAFNRFQQCKFPLCHCTQNLKALPQGWKVRKLQAKQETNIFFSHSYHVCLTICTRKTFNVRTVVLCHSVRLLILTIVEIIIVIECCRLACFVFRFFIEKKKTQNLLSPCFSRKVFRTILMKFRTPRHDGMPKQNKERKAK